MSPWDIPVFRMAYFAQKSHRDFCSKTLMLQPLRGLRTPHRPIVSLCFSPKRTTSRFASLTLRTAHRPIVSSPLAAAAALWLPCVRGAVRRSGLRGCPLGVGGKGKGPAVPFPSLRTEPALRATPVFRSAYSASRNARASAAFAASIEAHCAFSSKTLMLQVRFAHPPSAHRNLLSEGSGVPHGLFCNSAPNRLFKPLRCSGRLIRQAETLDLQPLRGLHRSTLRCLL